MKTKYHLFISIAGLLAAFLSACAGAAPDLPVAGGDTGTTIVAEAPVQGAGGNQPLSGNPDQGGPQNGRGPRDLIAAAEALGVTVEQLQQALEDARPAECASADGQPVQGVDCRADLDSAAAALGVMAEELQAALGNNKDGRGERDLAAAAEALGVTVEELEQAIQAAKPAECAEGTQPVQGVDCRPNVDALAESLGVTVEELEAALGNHAGPDFAAAADSLGVTEEELQQALEESRPTECADTEEGAPRDPNCRPDFEAAAESLGVTTVELQEALGKPEGGPRGPGGPDGQGGQGGPNGGQPPAQP